MTSMPVCILWRADELDDEPWSGEERRHWWPPFPQFRRRALTVEKYFYGITLSDREHWLPP